MSKDVIGSVRLQVSDNSGAKVAQCITQSGRSWGIGDTITVAIKKAATKGELVHADLLLSLSPESPSSASRDYF